MPVLDYLLVRELLGRGGALRALITGAGLFCLVATAWALAGQDAVGTLIKFVLWAGVVAILCLPLLGLFMAMIWLIAAFGPADKKLPAKPVAALGGRTQVEIQC